MNPEALSKVSAGSAAEICRHFELPQAARLLLHDGLTPRQFLDVLVEKRQYVAAVDFLAHALPPREAVWWACLCVREAAGPNLPTAQTAALKGATQWVLDPNEDNRRTAGAAGEEADAGTAAGCAALAAFWSGGSLNPPGLPEVAPAPFMTARAVSGSVLLSAAEGAANQLRRRHRRFVALGAGVAGGRFIWPVTVK